MTPNVQVSDVSLLRSDGAATSLATFAGRKVVLIFLRHLT